MSEQIINCVDIAGYNPSAADVVTLHFADIGGVYGGVYYAERLKQPGLFTTNLFSAGTTSGESQVGAGETVLMNSDGALDYLSNWGFDGRDILFKQFTLSLGMVLVMSCTMEQPTFTSTEVSITVKDYQAQFNVSIQPTKYAGTNVGSAGIEGTSDIQGQPKPLTFGPAYNETPMMVNTSKLIYQMHESTCTIPAVYDMGVPLVQGADYADQTAMEATAPDAGTYRACPSLGCFRLGSYPAGTITADVVEGATAADRTAAQIAKRIALRAIPSGKISDADVAALDSKNSSEVGIYIKDESTILAALDQILGSIGAWYAFDINGVLRMGRLEIPTGTPDVTLTADDYLSLERVASSDATKGVPPYKVNLQYEKNYTVQSGSDLTGSVTYSSIPYWDNLSISELPNVLKHHASVIYKNYLYVIGGVNASGNTDAVLRLDLTSPTGDWETMSPMPAVRSDHSAVVYGDYLYVIGGTAGASVIRLDLSNPVAGWEASGVYDLPAARAMHTSIVFNNYLYVIGGTLGGFPTTSVIRLDLITPTAWDDMGGAADLPSVNNARGKTAVYNNYLYSVSGSALTAGVIRLNLTAPTGGWETGAVTDLPPYRYYHSVVVYDHFLYVIGGHNLSTVIRIDLDNPLGAWESIAELPDQREFASAVIYKANLLLTGGYSGKHNADNPNTYIYRILIERDYQLWLMDEYRTVTDSDPTVQTTHLLAPEMSVDTLLIDATDAQTECTRLLNLYKVRRDMFTVEVPASVLAYIQPGKTLKLYSPRYGLSAGKLFIVIGIVLDWELGKTTLTIWG